MANNFVVKDGNGNALTIRSTDDGTTAQIMNTRIADATAANFMPTMDVAARAGFIKVTDGTNTMPTMDVAARPGFVKLTDGTNTMPTMDVVTRPGFIKVTDGTNTQALSSNVSVFASAAHTTTQTSADITVANAKAIHVILDMTNVGTGSVTITINAKDATSGKYYALLVGAAVITNSTNIYRVGLGLTAAANAVANDAVPVTLQIVVTANNANSATYSVGLNVCA